MKVYVLIEPQGEYIESGVEVVGVFSSKEELLKVGLSRITTNLFTPKTIDDLLNQGYEIYECILDEVRKELK